MKWQAILDMERVIIQNKMHLVWLMTLTDYYEACLFVMQYKSMKVIQVRPYFGLVLTQNRIILLSPH